jgi:hypothetical protein
MTMKHYHIDIDELRQLWEAGWLVHQLSQRYECTLSMIYWLRKKYGIRDRLRSQSTEPPAPSEADELLSRDSLALSPWVEARARECRERHFAQRRREPIA